MPKDTKTLGNNKARACESLGFAHKKGCANILTQPHQGSVPNRNDEQPFITPSLPDTPIYPPAGNRVPCRLLPV